MAKSNCDSGYIGGSDVIVSDIGDVDFDLPPVEAPGSRSGSGTRRSTRSVDSADSGLVTRVVAESDEPVVLEAGEEDDELEVSEIEDADKEFHISDEQTQMLKRAENRAGLEKIPEDEEKRSPSLSRTQSETDLSFFITCKERGNGKRKFDGTQSCASLRRVASFNTTMISNSEVTECERMYFRRNALCDPQRLLITQDLRERIQRDMLAKKKGPVHKMVVSVRSSLGQEVEEDLF